MKKSIAPLCVALLSLLGQAMTLNATIIYTDLSPTGGWTLAPLNGEVGNQITVAGTDRFVTRLGIEIYSQNGLFPNGTPGFADFRAQLYANDGALGQPGSLLWQSAVTHVDYPGGLTLLSFDVPQVLVPQTFTWTLQYANTSPIPPGLPGANAPTVGSNDASYWFRSPGYDWTHALTGGNFMAQIEAIPEPSAGPLFLAGALAFWLRRRLNTSPATLVNERSNAPHAHPTPSKSPS